MSELNQDTVRQKEIGKDNLVENKIRDTLSILPRREGVYMFKDSRGKIIYIGKAKNLYNRVKSYFQSKDSSIVIAPRISYFGSKIHTIDYIVTDNEVEALILESNLIKKNRPKYNIDLKDDKSYPYIAITENEKFPRVFMTRNRNIKGAKYFGPYTNVKSVKKTLDILRKLFQIRDCKKEKPGKVSKSPCLNYHINLCSAPCINNISENVYRKNIEYIKLFLKGKDKTIINELKIKMEEYSKNKDFEKAAQIKDKIDAINKLYEDQKILIAGEETWDVISLHRDLDLDLAAVSLFIYKAGELAVINNFTISNISHLKDEEILSDFIKKYYVDINNMPSKIYIPWEIEDMEIISTWLSNTKDKRIEIKVPKIGEKKKIMDMVIKNSKLYLEKKKFEKDAGYNKVYKDIIKLKEVLGLKNIPRRIECFDISNLKDSFPVGSMVVFVDGHPFKSNYRHFRIKNVSIQDDCRMIEEVLLRRLRYLEGSEIDIENSFYVKPDLMVIDGGKAQFNTVNRVLAQKNISGIDVISIAKKEETIFCDKYKDGIKIELNNNYSRIITKIRDEAHRFAVEYHRKLRGNYMIQSVLDGIKGIGEKKKRYIFEKFGTIETLKASSIEDLINIKGITYKDAVNIYNSIHR